MIIFLYYSHLGVRCSLQLPLDSHPIQALNATLPVHDLSNKQFCPNNSLLVSSLVRWAAPISCQMTSSYKFWSLLQVFKTSWYSNLGLSRPKSRMSFWVKENLRFMGQTPIAINIFPCLDQNHYNAKSGVKQRDSIRVISYKNYVLQLKFLI